MSASGGKGSKGSGDKRGDTTKSKQAQLRPANIGVVVFSEKYIAKLTRNHLQKTMVTTLAESLKVEEQKRNKEQEKESDIISLAFSLLKRDLGIHDFAKIIPELVIAYERSGLMDGKSNNIAATVAVARLQVKLQQYAHALLDDYAQREEAILKYAREMQAGRKTDQKVEMPHLDKLRNSPKFQNELNDLRELLIMQFKLNRQKGPAQALAAKSNSIPNNDAQLTERTRPLPKPTPYGTTSS